MADGDVSGRDIMLAVRMAAVEFERNTGLNLVGVTLNREAYASARSAAHAMVTDKYLTVEVARYLGCVSAVYIDGTRVDCE